MQWITAISGDLINVNTIDIIGVLPVKNPAPENEVWKICAQQEGFHSVLAPDFSSKEEADEVLIELRSRLCTGQSVNMADVLRVIALRHADVSPMIKHMGKKTFAEIFDEMGELDSVTARQVLYSAEEAPLSAMIVVRGASQTVELLKVLDELETKWGIGVQRETKVSCASTTEEPS